MRRMPPNSSQPAPSRLEWAQIWWMLPRFAKETWRRFPPQLASWSMLSRPHGVRSATRKRPEFLLIHAAGQHSSIYRQDCPGYEAGGVGREEDGRAHQFFQFSEPVHGRPHDDFFSSPRADQEFLAQRSP